MKKIVTITFLLLIGFLGLVSSALPPPFLGAQDPRSSPAESARIGDPVSASVQLIKITPAVPKEASLIIHTDAVSPIFRINVDGVEQLPVKSDVEIDLSVDTVKEISIEVNGKAPTVEALTEMKLLKVELYSYYDEENKGTQTLVDLPLRVSTQEILDTVRSINTAKSEYDKVEALTNDLEAQGKDVVELRSRLLDAKDTIRIADEAEARGETTNAKTLADQAIRELERIKADATKEAPVQAPADIQRYLVIGGAIILVLLIFVFIKGRREELG
ncbi:MAG: hypothetical protein V3V92_02830 [Candidatus Hydrothermarchaeales archaeon]